MEQQEAISRVLAGETDEFAEIITKYHRSVCTYIAGTFPDAVRVEEIAQDVFVRAFYQLPHYDIGRPFWPWLRGIARNALREELRKLERAARDRRAFTEAALIKRAERMATESPASLDFRQKSLEALRTCIEKLAEKARRLLAWFYEDNLSSKEIAEKAGLGSSAVRNALVKIRTKLRRCVQSEIGVQES
jgi:RNA polymerase sigma-70 factor (ECF subfamily)